MRILAIRGKNLASLAGTFEVDFRVEPLASAGLFAIGGPTGSGKSTLLDALCVALYNDTPRLRGIRARRVNLPDVADATLSVQDPRNILRRGTAEGYAEVDFVGNDGVEYCARWTVRRARGQPSGKLQAAEMRLTRLADGTPVGDGLRDVQEAITSRLGLTFGQFTRAVLLAQNEFFAFLQVDDNDRAELLEALTGSEDLAVISQRAFERSKIEQIQLESLRERLAGEKPLDAEARLQLEASCAAAESEVDRQEKRKTQLEFQLRWHAECQDARTSEAAAQAALDLAIADQAAAAPRQEVLDLVEAVQEARPKISDRDRCVREVEGCRQAAASAASAAGEAGLKAEATEGELAAARTSLAKAEATMEAAKPEIDRARALDAQFEALAPGHTQVRQAREQARDVEKQAHDAIADHDRERHRQTLAFQSAKDWLTNHRALQPLGELWSRWDSLLVRAGVQASKCTAEEANLRVAQSREEHCRVALQDAEAALGPASAALADAESQLADCTSVLEAFDLESLARRKTTLELRRDRLAAASAHWKDLFSDQDRQRELGTKERTLRSTMAAAEARRIDVARQLPQAEAGLRQAERSRDAARVACSENVETLRHTLVSGEPCPVCGSREHPYAIEEPRLGSVLDGLEAEVARCGKEVYRLRQDDASDQTLTRSVRQQLGDNEEERARLETGVAASRAAWTASAVAAEIPELEPAARADWLLRERDATQSQLTDHGVKEGDHRRALTGRDRALDIRDRAVREHAKAVGATHAARLEFDRAVAASQHASDMLSATRSQRSALLDELDTAFPSSSWRDCWAANPVAFHEASRVDASDWITQSRYAQELAAAIAAFDAERKGLSSAGVTATERHQRAAADLASADRQHQSLIEERRRVLGARRVAEVEAELQQRVATARAREIRLAGVAHQAAESKARMEQALIQAGSALGEREAALSHAESALAEWISTFNVSRTEENVPDLAGIRSLLNHSPGWLAGERKVLRLLGTAVERESAVLRDRAARREALEGCPATAEPEQAVRLAMSAATHELGPARGRAAGLRLGLTQDDQRRDRSADLMAKLQTQEQIAGVWARLNQLIGSADGKKLRNYAQQLTLDVLLVHANRHLEDLARRYRLVRVKDTLALLVVDNDMGGEIRSVHSLSGGETFLVSLALALGLASLSSHRVIVESLFIDEGFGSLDSDTLATALDALDRLQAQGRKVGVISHVQEMTERIATQIQIRKRGGGRSEVVIGPGTDPTDGSAAARGSRRDTP